MYEGQDSQNNLSIHSVCCLIAFYECGDIMMQMCQPTYMRCGILFPVRGNNGPAERKAHDVHTSSATVHRVVCCPLCECLWKPVWKTSYMVMPACFLCAEEGEQCPDCGLVSHCKAHRKVFPYKSRHSTERLPSAQQNMTIGRFC